MHQGDRRQGAAASGSGGVPAGVDLPLAQRRELVRTAVDALAGVEGVLHQGVGAELGPFFAELDALRRGCEAGQVATLAEALERGEVSSSCASAAGWVLEWAPSYRGGGAGDLVKVAQACLGRPVGAELGPFFAELDALRRGCEAGQVATLAEALERGEVSSSCATAAGWVLEWAPSYRCGGGR